MPKDLAVIFDSKTRRGMSNIKSLPLLGKYLARKLPNIVADAYIKRLKENWMKADAAYAALNVDYKKAKQRYGLDDSIWLATHTLIENIVKKGLVSGRVVVTLNNTQHPNSNLSLQKIAASVEFGRLDKGQPPRPLWRDTFKQLYPELQVLISVETRKLATVFFS